jgi:TolB-like protein
VKNLILASLLMASGSAAAVEGAVELEKPRLIVLELEPISVDRGEVQIIDGRLAELLASQSSFVTVTTQDLQKLIDLNASKQELDGACDTDACLAEVAGALGAEFIVFGRVGRLGDAIVVQLNLFDAQEARPIARRDRGRRPARDLRSAAPRGAAPDTLARRGGPFKRRYVLDGDQPRRPRRRDGRRARDLGRLPLSAARRDRARGS